MTTLEQRLKTKRKSSRLKLLFGTVGAIGFTVIAVLFLYSIDKSKETQIEKELMVRRAVKVEL